MANINLNPGKPTSTVHSGADHPGHTTKGIDTSARPNANSYRNIPDLQSTSEIERQSDSRNKAADRTYLNLKFTRNEKASQNSNFDYRPSDTVKRSPIKLI